MYSLVQQELIEYLFCVRHCTRGTVFSAKKSQTWRLDAPWWLGKARESGIHNAVNVQTLIILESHARAAK